MTEAENSRYITAVLGSKVAKLHFEGEMRDITKQMGGEWAETVDSRFIQIRSGFATPTKLISYVAFP